MNPKIFFIGMDHSANQPLSDLMRDSGCSVASVSSGRRNLAKTIKRNLVAGNDPLLTISDSIVYTEMTYFENDDYIEGNQYYRQLYEAYPDAYFILNYVTEASWLASRMSSPLLEKCQQIMVAGKPLTPREVVWEWMTYRVQHHSTAIKWFTSDPIRNKQFLVLDVAYDDISKLVNFVSKDYTLDSNQWMFSV
jgi:hypothetical protein